MDAGSPNTGSDPVFSIEHGFAKVWERICPPSVHTCSYCQKLCIYTSVADSALQCLVLSMAEISRAARGGCIVFLWLHQILERSEGLQHVEERYFTLSLARGELTHEVNVESNNPDELDHVFHGRLGCFMYQNRRGSREGHLELMKCMPLNVDVSSKENLRHSQNWLSECHEFHSICRGSNRGKLPSRVLDVCDGVRLVETGREYDGKYAVLSYCWGGNQPILTTKHSRPLWMKSIPFGELPQTIKDAITTTRGLGLRYLWIDALCIIQDDIEDQMREIPLMSEIYQGAYVTISAASASNCYEGFLHQRTPEIACVPCVHADGRLEALNLYKELGVADEPIHKRAWTLQEHVLSCRILEYGTQELRRVCRGDPGNADVSNLDRYDPTKFDKSVWTFPQNAEFTLKHFWRPLVHMFTTRDITNASDRPLAIQGIADEYVKVLKSPFLAGIWTRRDLFTRELLWQTDVIRARVGNRTDEAVPSWSWLAVEGASVKWRDWPSDYSDKTVEVTGYENTSKVPSYLKVRGYLRKAVWDRARGCLVSANDLGQEPVAKTAADVTGKDIDQERDVQVDTLDILRTPDGTAVVGLVLLRENGAAEYQRAGLFWTSEISNRGMVRTWLASSRISSVLLR